MRRWTESRSSTPGTQGREERPKNHVEGAELTNHGRGIRKSSRSLIGRVFRGVDIEKAHVNKGERARIDVRVGVLWWETRSRGLIMMAERKTNLRVRNTQKISSSMR